MNEFNNKAATWDNDPEKHKRAQKVSDILRTHISSLKYQTALEYGSGTGLLSFNLMNDFETIVLADSADGMLEIALNKINEQNIKNMQTWHVDLVHENITNPKFDIIYSLLTLHHVVETSILLKKFYQLLKPGGSLFVFDLDKEDGSFHGDGFIGHNGFDRTLLTKDFLNAGFQNIYNEICFNLNRFRNDKKLEFPLFLIKGNKPIN